MDNTIDFKVVAAQLANPEGEAAQELLLANGFTVIDTHIREHKTTGATKQELIREEVFIRARQAGGQANF